jgi:NAD-dependent SIR2 family protein deacetylase
MQIVTTKNHLIYSAHEGAPSYACIGECGKVWWQQDVSSDFAVVAVPACPQCGGRLTGDIPAGHYVVVTDQAGALNKGGAIITNAGLKLGN